MKKSPGGFRKLDVDLPKHRLSDSAKWFIAGLVLMFLILAFILFAYLQHRLK
jgi:hypothetical protein